MSYQNINFSYPTFLENAINKRQVNIELAPAVYTMDYSLVLKNHDVVIKGSKNENGLTTTIMIGESLSFGSGIHSVFKIFGQFDNNKDDKISVEIQDLIIQTNVSQSAANHPLSDIAMNISQIFEFRNIKSLKMRNVKIVCQNIATTCVEIQRGFNIDIRDCVFANYNRRKQGGVLWLRGDTVNARIEHCDIYKYGGDEAIAIWNPNNFEGYNIISSENLLHGINEIHKKNIRISHNRIFCQDANGGVNSGSIISEGNSNWNGINQRFITLFTNQDNNTTQSGGQHEVPCHYILEGIEFSNNEMHINSPVAHLMTVALDKYTTFKDISIKNNIINYGDWKLPQEENDNTSYVLEDFGIYYDTVYDYSQIEGNYDLTSDEPFYIIGNTIICGNNIRNNLEIIGDEMQYYDNHRCLDIKGTKVLFNNNFIICNRDTYTPDESAYAKKGLQLFRCTDKGGEVVFNNNHCEGIMTLLRVTGESNLQKLPLIKLSGRGNYLQGDTRIIHTNVTESHITLIANELISDYPLFFLSEFADTGTARFIGNKVTREMSRVNYYSTPQGIIYYTGNTGNTNMKLICCDNVFDNISYSSSMYYCIGLMNDIDCIHVNNIFDDDIE